MSKYVLSDPATMKKLIMMNKMTRMINWHHLPYDNWIEFQSITIIIIEWEK